MLRQRVGGFCRCLGSPSFVGLSLKPLHRNELSQCSSVVEQRFRNSFPLSEPCRKPNKSALCNNRQVAQNGTFGLFRCFAVFRQGRADSRETLGWNWTPKGLANGIASRGAKDGGQRPKCFAETVALGGRAFEGSRRAMPEGSSRNALRDHAPAGARARDWRSGSTRRGVSRWRARVRGSRCGRARRGALPPGNRSLGGMEAVEEFNASGGVDWDNAGTASPAPHGVRRHRAPSGIAKGECHHQERHKDIHPKRPRHEGRDAKHP